MTTAASSRRTNARSSLWYLRKHNTLTQIAAGFGIPVGTAHAYTSAVIDLLADRSPGLLKVLRDTDPQYVLPDGTPAECDRRNPVNTSQQFTSLAAELGVRLSVGRTGQCWDNALAESFFSTIKRELLGTSA